MRAIRFSFPALLIVVALVGCAGTPTFMQLADTKWQLTQLDGQPVDTESMRRTPYLLLHADQRLEGFTGCNRVNGRYSGSDDSLRFDSLASTRRYCNQGMDIEEAFRRLTRIYPDPASTIHKNARRNQSIASKKLGKRKRWR